MLGAESIVLHGTTVVIYDTPTFMKVNAALLLSPQCQLTCAQHLYHWFGEIILGFWRVYCKIADSEGPVPLPSRFMIPVRSIRKIN